MSQAVLLGATGQMIAALGTETFPVALADLLRLAVPYSYTVVFGYRGAARPLDLFDDFPDEKRNIFVTDYLEGPYLLDPFFLAANRAVAPGLYRMRSLAPDRFFQGEYYRNYYAQTGLAEEVGFFIDIAPSCMIVVSLMRAEKVFSSREMGALRELVPVVIAATRRHWAGLENPSSSKRPPAAGDETKVEMSFAAFGRDVLTAREREIVEHTLKGHSAEAIGTLLGIASGTVRIHRRNVYAKLRISSQGELFSRFIQTLGKT